MKIGNNYLCTFLVSPAALVSGGDAALTLFPP